MMLMMVAATMMLKVIWQGPAILLTSGRRLFFLLRKKTTVFKFRGMKAVSSKSSDRVENKQTHCFKVSLRGTGQVFNLAGNKTVRVLIQVGAWGGADGGRRQVTCSKGKGEKRVCTT